MIHIPLTWGFAPSPPKKKKRLNEPERAHIRKAEFLAVGEAYKAIL